MAGNKNSGRKSFRHEIAAKNALELSIKTIVGVLRDETLPIELRLKAAIPIASKYFPDKIEVNDVNALTHDDKIRMLASFKMLLDQRKILDVAAE